MPVYIRKNISYTPPSVDEPPPEDEDDYLNDPELTKDTLPQPYRMIDKTLNILLEKTWDEISQREATRIEESKKIRPPEYEYSICLDGPVPGTPFPEKQTLTYATCMTDSVDGQYIFIGLPCGLVALDALDQTFSGSWEEEGAEITFIKSYLLGPQTYLINTIDDMGIGRLFAFTGGKMFLLKMLNSNPQDSDPKILVGKLESSADGEYMGVVMENVSAKEMWLEVHKLPKENWLNELDTVVQALKKKEEKKDDQLISEDNESVAGLEQEPQQAVETLPPQTAPLDTHEQSQSSQTEHEKSHSGTHTKLQLSMSSSSLKSLKMQSSILSRLLSRGSKRQESVALGSGGPSPVGTPDTDHQVIDVNLTHDPLAGEYKFSPPQLVMKVKPPPQITGVTLPNLSAICQKVDGGDVIGTGQNYLFTQSHLDLRKSVFDHLHDNLLKYLPQEEDDLLALYPCFHFLTAGRMLPMGLEQPALEGHPTTIAVWWPGSTNLIQYSLIKTSKDIEFKPDLVWPFTCKITATTVSEDTNVIVIGLEDGNIVIWDRYMGTQRGIVSVSDSPIVQLKFLDPSLYPKEDMDYPPYPTKSCAYLLVLCANSALYTVNTGPGTTPYPNCITPDVENDDDKVTMLQPLSSSPELSLTVIRKGVIQIRDTLQGTVLCQMQLPDGFEIATPWEPVLAVGGQGIEGQGPLLFVKATRVLEEDGLDIESGTGNLQSGTVFMYQLHAFPPLEAYWKKKRKAVPFTVHTKYQERVNALMADRIARQPERKARMQERWSLLKEEINSIHKIKEMARKNAEMRPLFTPGSVGTTYSAKGQRLL